MTDTAGLERAFYQVADHSHPYLAYDAAKCDGCGRCVQYATAVACCDALALTTVAGRTIMQPRPSRRFVDSDCLACGGCADICPTAAIRNRYGDQNITGCRTVHTRCFFCGLACPITYHIDDRQQHIAAVTQPGTNEPSCPFARYGHEYIHHPRRYVQPMIRAGREFQPTDCDRAATLCRGELKRIVETHGPDAVGLVIGPGLCLEDISATIRFGDRLGLSNVYFLPEPCRESFDGPFADASELVSVNQANDTAVVNLAGHPLADCFVLRSRIERLVRAGAKYIACDPSSTGLADRWDEPVDRERVFVIVPSWLANDRNAFDAMMNERFRFIVHSPHANAATLTAYVRRRHKSVRMAAAAELVTAIVSGTIRGLYLVDADPVSQLPGGPVLAEAFAKLEFVAAHTVFATPSSRRADVVWPLASPLEADGTILDGTGAVCRVAKVFDPPGQVRRVRDVVDELRQRMGRPVPADQSQTPDAIGASPPAEGGPGRLRLVLRDTPWHKGTGGLTVRTDLAQLQNYDAAVFNQDDATMLDIHGGELVVLGTANADIAVRAVISTAVRPGWVRISNHFNATCAQILWPVASRLTDPVWVTARPLRGRRGPPTADQKRYRLFRRYGRGRQGSPKTQ